MKIETSLPRFGDMTEPPRFPDDSDDEPTWREQLAAHAYVDVIDVGRGVYLSGRVSWRTLPGKEGWHPDGSHLYRVYEDGPGRYDAPDPTAKMIQRVRDEVEPHLPAPTHELRVATAVREVKHRLARAEAAYSRAMEDAVLLTRKMEVALGLDAGELYVGGRAYEEVHNA